MSFNNYLKSKLKFIVFYFCFHGFALFVNLFRIEGRLNGFFRVFTSRPEWDIHPEKDFWPFVSIIEWIPWASRYAFQGVFRSYDISEFIAYLILILLALYLRWDFKFKKK